MALIDLSNLPPSGPLLGIDPGTRRVGVAISDSLRFTAHPVEGVLRQKKLAPVLHRIFELYDSRACVGIVLGLPLNMDGSKGPRAQAARAFSRSLLELRDVPLAFQDERLSSAQAERAMIEADLTRARRAQLIDKSAAAIILQTALDYLANTGPE